MAAPPRATATWKSINSWLTAPFGITPSNVAAFTIRLRNVSGPSRAGANGSMATIRVCNIQADGSSGRKSGMAGFVEPMKAISGELPDGDGWAFEVKWDGMRVVVAVDGDTMSAWSARGAVVTQRFPELQELAGAVDGHTAVLDCEVVVLDAAGRSSFSRMQGRMHVDNPAKVELIRRETPVHAVVFDLLHLDGHDLFDVPYTDRRQLLVDLVEPTAHVLVPEHSVGNGPALFAAAAANGLEGLMAKRLDSLYQPGKRS